MRVVTKVLEVSKSGAYTLEKLKNGNYVIKCNGQVMRYGEHKTLESIMLRWPCCKYA